ncbi:DUF2956 domain-containing protein [uncultured Shewanella sp.]|uniref:DUF2956 domain-containing protein n=1 Tax=uncultured Shewanella sp. TaxID=173975 RepID=UPI00261A70BE|nr:DUF2956 domain-containing protein [uncultured Shewanella sp.]
MASPISNETKDQALKMAKATQKPGQTKEQTKLIAQGIEKGISEYKKHQKAKARHRDKQRKQSLKKTAIDEQVIDTEINTDKPFTFVPWLLLILSWALFAIYHYLIS